jgi:heme O synthase-like polyprenyltransferase
MTGISYFYAAVVLDLAFLAYGIKCALTGSRPDARRLFLVSIIYLPALLGVMMAAKR